MPLVKNLVVSTMLLVTGVACPGGCPGPDSGNPDGGSQAGQDVDALCRQLVQAQCENLISCGQALPDFLADCVASSERSVCQVQRESVERGYATFLPDRANESLKKVQEASCDNPASAAAQAWMYLEGKVASGGRCARSTDCADSSLGCGGSGCDKTCQARGGLGQACGDGCSEGLYCDQAADTCRTRIPLGGDCTSVRQCQEDLLCDSAQSKCVALPGAAQPCASYKCNDASYCDQAQRCQPRLATGATCSFSSQCALTDHCPLGSRKCTARLALGAACTSADECLETASCQAGTCRQRLPLGGTCVRDADCVSPLRCDSITRQCQPSTQVATGAACTGSQVRCLDAEDRCKGAVPSPNGGVGTWGACQPALTGDSCMASFDCARHDYCARDTQLAGTCTRAALGTSCVTGTQCLAEHTCIDGTCQARQTEGQACEVQVFNEPCIKPFRCLPGSAEEPSKGTCRLPGQPGEACVAASVLGVECLGPAVCKNSVCVRTGGLNQPCLLGILCYTGACTGATVNDPTAGICTSPRATGEPCTWGGDCTSNRCEDSVCAAVCP